MSPSDYAAKHGITLAYVWRLIRKGRIQAEKVDGKLRSRISGEHEKMKCGPKKKI